MLQLDHDVRGSWLSFFKQRLDDDDETLIEQKSVYFWNGKDVTRPNNDDNDNSFRA